MGAVFFWHTHVSANAIISFPRASGAKVRYTGIAKLAPRLRGGRTDRVAHCDTLEMRVA